MKIASVSFAEGAFIAPEFAYGRIGENGATERSENRNPELHWTDVPEGTKSFVVLCLDDDVPTDRQTKMGDGLLSVTQPRRRFVHWVQANIPAEVESIPEGFLTGDQKRNGAFGHPGVNDYVGNATPGPDGTGLGYDGPCPPFFDARSHYYRFSVLALDCELADLPEEFRLADVEERIAGHVLATAETVCRYTLNPALAN